MTALNFSLKPSPPWVVLYQKTLNAIARAILISAQAEEFALLLISCNDLSLRPQLIDFLGHRTELHLQELTLHPCVTSLVTTVESCLQQAQPQVLMITGLETLTNLQEFLENINTERNALKTGVKIPMILWVTDEVLAKIQRYAPDLRNWAGNAYHLE